MDLCLLSARGVVGGGAIAAAEGTAWRMRRKRVLVVRQSVICRRDCGGDVSGVFGGRAVEMRMLVAGMGQSGQLGCRFREVRATGKNNDQESSPTHGSSDPSIPEEDAYGEESISGSAEAQSEEGLNQESESSNLGLDWRTFRASLVAQETEQTEDSGVLSGVQGLEKSSSGVNQKWAHPISTPETGCVLVATDKLNGMRNFERTVVLLLRVGTRDYREGPFGVILNRPLNKKIKEMQPTDVDLATTFSECSLHFGGPLDASIFLVRTNGGSFPPSFERVVPGVCVGARNNLKEAAALVKKGVCHPKDFRFFVGYAGWQLDQLRHEIEAGYWVVAACSADFISSADLDSSSGLWEDILQLVGGRNTSADDTD